MTVQRRNCWDIMDCGREPGGRTVAALGVCPSTVEERCEGMNGGHNGGRICWAVAGTFCEGVVQGTFANKLATCMSCRFYLQVQAEQADDFRHVPDSQPSAEDYEQVARAYSQLHQLYAELALARQQLEHGERLREVGQLAAGVAHEINNPLTPIFLAARSNRIATVGGVFFASLRLGCETKQELTESRERGTWAEQVLARFGGERPFSRKAAKPQGRKGRFVDPRDGDPPHRRSCLGSSHQGLRSRTEEAPCARPLSQLEADPGCPTPIRVTSSAVGAPPGPSHAGRATFRGCRRPVL